MLHRERDLHEHERDNGEVEHSPEESLLPEENFGQEIDRVEED